MEQPPLQGFEPIDDRQRRVQAAIDATKTTIDGLYVQAYTPRLPASEHQRILKEAGDLEQWLAQLERSLEQ